MKAVILAAGKSTRTYPLTLTIPKPLLRILGKTLIEHTLDQLIGIVDEAIIVVGYKKDMIKNFLGKKYNNIKLTYAEQKEQSGTANALLTAEPYLEERFLMLYGDDLYSQYDLKNMLKHKLAVLAKKVDNPSRFGVFIADNQSNLKKIVEKPDSFVSDLANIGCYLLNPAIFPIIKQLKKSKRGEYELTDAVTQFALKNKIRIVNVEDYWLPIAYWWNYLEASVFMLSKINNSKISGTVEKNVTVKGILILGECSIIKSGTYIEGPVYIGKNCIIGPFAHLRPDTIIFDNVILKSETYDSVIMSHTTSKHQSYIGHSVIGESCNIACGTVTADYRHDGKNNITVINGKKVDSGRRKLGTCIGNNVNTGINTSIYPGRKIWPGKTTLPGEIVTKDIQ